MTAREALSRVIRSGATAATLRSHAAIPATPLSNTRRSAIAGHEHRAHRRRRALCRYRVGAAADARTATTAANTANARMPANLIRNATLRIHTS